MAAAREQQKANEMQALQDEADAREQRAIGVIQREEKRREKELHQATLQARAASSGFTSTDATSLYILGDLEEYGGYLEDVAQYSGDSSAKKLEYGADVRRQFSKAQYAAAKASAVGSILGGFGSFAKSFGGGGGSQAVGIYS